MNALLISLSFVAAQPEPSEASARSAFQTGMESRDDARAARAAFAKSARHYSALWSEGRRTPELAQAWARAEFLSGRRATAIAVVHSGLKLSPWHAGLQADLEVYRDAVPLSDPTLRTPRNSGWQYRIGPWPLFAGFTFCCVAIGIGITRRYSIASRDAPIWLSVGFLGLFIVMISARQRHIEFQESRPVWVVRSESTLRRGNAESYPAALEVVLPTGVEVRDCNRRGGWMQVQLANGSLGWLPESELLRIE